jgi:hypothetical protein
MATLSEGITVVSQTTQATRLGPTTLVMSSIGPSPTPGTFGAGFDRSHPSPLAGSFQETTLTDSSLRQAPKRSRAWRDQLLSPK